MPAADKKVVTIDLDAARAARREKLEVKRMRVDGKVYDLPVEMPAEYAFAWATSSYNEAVAALLGAEAAAAFMRWAALDDYWEFGRQVEDAYGMGGEGGSSASGGS